MAYRNGTYIAFHAGGITDPTASDIKYYNTIKMWCAHKHIDFNLVNSHEKTSAVRDSSTRTTLRNALASRLRNSKHMLLILTLTTKNDNDWVPFEIQYAIDVCKLPIIAAYPDYRSILAPGELSGFWPISLYSRILSGSARVIHIPFKREPIFDAIDQIAIHNTNYPSNGYGFYSKETQMAWGLINS